jgi:probable rRNA maturation factor
MDVTFKKLSIKCDPIVSVSIVDNRYIHKINKKYRHIDRPTDVISFAFLDSENNYDKVLFLPGPVVLGDIYISLEKAKEQAEEYGHSLHRELSFLFVHGLLHLLGYDHMNEEDEKEMFQLQEEILSEKGV